MKKDLVFILGATSNLAFAAANTIMSICDNCTLDFDIILFEENFSEKDKELINSIHKTQFVSYDFPSDCEFKPNVIAQFPKMAFSRYEAFKLIKNYKKVFWLDVDILVNKNIDELINSFDKEIAILCDHMPVKNNFMRNLEGYDMQKSSCNSGVFIISDKIKEPEKIYKYLYAKTEEYSKILYCPDQGVFCLMLQDFDLDILDIGALYNCHPTSKNAKNAYILHTFRPEKFWNFYSNKKWNKNYKRWLEMGGSQYSGKKANLWTKFWKTFFYEYPDPFRYPKGFLKKIFENN